VTFLKNYKTPHIKSVYTGKESAKAYTGKRGRAKAIVPYHSIPI
jgi:hypothetical protein